MSNTKRKKKTDTWTIQPHQLFEYVTEFLESKLVDDVVVNIHDPFTIELDLTLVLDEVAKRDQPKDLDDTWCYDLGPDDDIREEFKTRASEGYNLRLIGFETDPDYTHILVRVNGYQMQKQTKPIPIER